MKSPKDLDGTLTELELQELRAAIKKIEDDCGQSRFPVNFDFSDDRPIVQDELVRQAKEAGWTVDVRGTQVSVKRP